VRLRESSEVRKVTEVRRVIATKSGEHRESEKGDRRRKVTATKSGEHREYK
jgi:hypothetical protein